MPKVVKLLIIIFAVLAILGGAAAFYILGYHLPYENAENTMPADTDMALYQQEDGSVLLTWPAGENTDRYLVEVLGDPVSVFENETVENVLYSAFIMDGTSHVLKDLPTDEEVTVRIQSAAPYSYPFEEEPRLRMGETAMQIRGVFEAPTITDLQWSADAETKQVTVDFSMPENSTARIFHMENDQPVLVESLSTGHHVLSFGEGGNYTMPAYDESHIYALDLIRHFDGYTFHGIISNSFQVVREDLLGTVLELTTIDMGNNQFSFTWNETKGEHYEFQQYNPSKKTWQTLHQVARDGERAYTTGHLSRYSEFTYRVVALGGQTLPDSEYAATPAKSTVTTGASVVYSTIWPIQKLNIYSDTQKTEVVGTAPAAKAYCVLDFVDGMFRIRYNQHAYGYIDANYCLINLPDMIGDKCLYNITNSYDSLYMVHEYEIPTVTGQICLGYEKIDLSNGKYLVPLLYPTSLKLEKAALAAIEKNYKLKIYDSFRPQKTTLMLYDTTSLLLSEPIPENTYTGVILNDLPVLGEGEVLSYERLMTDNGRYNLSYFLAKGGSRHNQGLALDLTLVNLRTGEELEMQSSMHDLTWYSERKRNNANANTLSKFMTNAGFATLTSEWWHYQDNEAKDNIKPAFLSAGVNCNCWIRDDNGWRYRLDNGKYYYKCSKTIGGVYYTFDNNGYAVDADGNRLDSI